jgi:tetratricopeptide (TPR) repeat protein
MNLLFIGLQNESAVMSGKATWKGEHLHRISAYTNISDLHPLNTPKGLAYLTGRDNFYSKCFSFSVNEIICKDNVFTVYYEVESQAEYTTMAVVSALRYVLLNDEQGKLIPFCAAVESSRFYKVIEDEAVIKNIKILSSKNNWEGIYRQFSPLGDLKNKPQYYNNPKLLEAISFAVAKLSEVYINVRKVYPDESKRKEFLKQKKQYRKEVIGLRKRCIELTPDSPGAYSNLGYSYYQFCRELILPGGRRDGSLLEDSCSAVEYINKALELDPNRITDLYRKGQLLTRIIPNAILFGGNGIISQDKVSEVREKITEGIKSFQKVETVYELIPEIDGKSLERYHKEYIKSLYDTSLAFESLVKADWNYDDYIFNGKINPENGNGFSGGGDMDNVDKGIQYIIKCIHKDRKNEPGKDTHKDAFQLASNIGEVEGVYKVYTLGKLYFRKYIVLSKSGRISESTEFAEKAFSLFKYSYKLPFSKEKSSQNKAFILEKIARYFISKGKYDEAVNTLERQVNSKFADYYIRYTYALAAILNSMEDRAAEQLNIAVRGFNPEKYLGYLMLGLIEHNMGNRKEVLEALKNGIITAGKKKNDIIDEKAIINSISEIAGGNTGAGTEKIKSQIQIPAKRLNLIIRAINHLYK